MDIWVFSDFRTLSFCGCRSLQAEAALPELFAAPKVRLPPMAASQARGQWQGWSCDAPRLAGRFLEILDDLHDSMTSPMLKEVLERQRQHARPPSSYLDLYGQLWACWAKGSQTPNPNVLSSWLGPDMIKPKERDAAKRRSLASLQRLASKAISKSKAG